MIIHEIKGNKNTTYFDFDVNIDGLTINFIGGQYWQNGQLVKEFQSESFNIVADTENTKKISVCVTTNGVQIIENDDIVENLLIKLAWMELEPNGSEFINVNKKVCVN
ncbi:hypothetical protein [Caloranaerobacter ferrireducens]|uniref:hypothetical protein n=1 Tax=Caloranaerobacter ferrireducens TaxID=1323370 RepID=UPI00084D91BD|nr:hypothetical protein [Caloranaerobacter ferrireducens]